MIIKNNWSYPNKTMFFALGAITPRKLLIRNMASGGAYMCMDDQEAC